MSECNVILMYDDKHALQLLLSAGTRSVSVYYGHAGHTIAPKICSIGL